MCIISSNHAGLFVVACLMPADPINGMVDCDERDDGILSYQDTCTTTCNTGYEIHSGDVMRTCQSDRTFSGTIATCIRSKSANWHSRVLLHSNVEL